MGNVFVNNPDGSKVNINEQLIKEGFAVRFGD